MSQIFENLFELTPLHQAIANGEEVKEIKKLIKSGSAIHTKDKDGNTALHVAVKEENLEAAKALLEAGAEIDVLDKDGQTPLHVAVCLGDLEFIELFIFNGASKDAIDNDGYTPLDRAIELNKDGDYDQIIDLLEM